MSVRLVGAGVSRGQTPRELEDSFPGRWNARRAMWPAAATLVHAIGRALHAAGWWQPGSGAAVDAGQVIGFDLHPIEPCRNFADSLGDPGKARATDFLFALPSSATALAGVAYGLPRYQATVASHELSGFGAVAHACDALATGRVERLVTAAMTASEDGEGVSMAVAWCLAREGSGPLIEGWGEIPVGEARAKNGTAVPAETHPREARAGDFGPARNTADAVQDVAQQFRPFSAPSLLGATRLLSEADPGRSILVTQPILRKDTPPPHAQPSIAVRAQSFPFEENPPW